VIAAGAHNALSAKLAEEAGFESVWVSGFEISASNTVPDANIVTISETLEITKKICENVSIPVIADCDNGYGNAINVIKTVEDFEYAGASAISIEDNVYPKRCSFYPGVKRELETIEEFVGKIRAAKNAQRSSDFMLIARTEAMIAGWGVQEALKRAKAYAEGGADMILIHSKESSPKQIIQFAKEWNHKKPLVAVPTTYKSFSVEEMYGLGYNLIIFANHGMRASIKAMQQVYSVLRKEKRADSVDDLIVNIEEVYRLVGLETLVANEKEFLASGRPNVKAIIVAAGFDKELMPLVAEIPKCMLDIKGKSILERQIDTLTELNVRDIVVVRGYKKEKIALPNIKYYDNDKYETTKNLYSLFSASEELKGPLIFLYGDIIFERKILQELLKSPRDIGLAVDLSWKDHKGREISPEKRIELVELETNRNGKGNRFVNLDQDNKITKIGGRLPRDKADGEFIGMAILSEKGTEQLKKAYSRALARYKDEPFQESDSMMKGHFADLIQDMIDHGSEIFAVETYKGWMEVDDFEDYKKTWAELKN